MKDNVKKAFELAEQEVQEKEINNLKGIIKDLLKKKAAAEEDKREIEKEISVIKQTIDDFKAGRLDKIKELMEKDSVAKDLLPFTVIIINQTIINQPWKWVYQVLPTYPIPYYPTLGGTYSTSGGVTLTSTSGTGSYTTTGTSLLGAGINTAYCATQGLASVSNDGWSGSNFATFTGGSYDINGRIINL
jgi:hypothetical protein